MLIRIINNINYKEKGNDLNTQEHKLTAYAKLCQQYFKYFMELTMHRKDHPRLKRVCGLILEKRKKKYIKHLGRLQCSGCSRTRSATMLLGWLEKTSQRRCW